MRNNASIQLYGAEISIKTESGTHSEGEPLITPLKGILRAFAMSMKLDRLKTNRSQRKTFCHLPLKASLTALKFLRLEI